MNKMERLIASLPTINVGNEVLTCHAFTRADSPNILRISGEHADSQMFIDYYGEYAGGYSFIHGSLLKWATDNGGYWEWEDPSNIAFYPL
jgi:hypothetical protein